MRGAPTLWLGTALLCLLFVPLCLFYMQLCLDSETIASTLRQALQLRLYWPSHEEMAALESEAAKALAAETQLSCALQQVQDTRASWSSALHLVLSAPSEGIRLASLAWKQNVLLLQGTADTPPDLDAYVQFITRSAPLAQVQASSDGQSFTITLSQRWRDP
ncbi:MAG: hypothetical protein ACUVX9_08030 [Anaerolineae bacterium]